MGKIANKLRRSFEQVLSQKIVLLAAFSEGKAQALKNIESVKSIGQMVEEGHDPIHAVYVNALNLVSIFAEHATTLPPLHKAHDFFTKAEDLYAPGYPPMSPITNSYFSMWAFFDAHFGDDRETIGSCFVALSDLLGVHPVQVEIIRKLCQSRMGIYEVRGCLGKTFRLREIVTEREMDAIIPSGFTAEVGELIFVRMLPPLEGVAPAHWVALTTPYVLLNCTREDWIEYFKRHEIVSGAVGVEARLHRHMKQGTGRYYWSEFAFYGYVNFRPDAIFLAGFPDRPKTQPCHDDFEGDTFHVLKRGTSAPLIL